MTINGYTITTPTAISPRGWTGYVYEIWKDGEKIERSRSVFGTEFLAAMRGWNRVNVISKPA